MNAVKPDTTFYSWDYDGLMIYLFEVTDLEWDENKRQLTGTTSFSNKFQLTHGIQETEQQIKQSISKWFSKNKADVVDLSIPVVFYTITGSYKELTTVKKMIDSRKRKTDRVKVTVE